MARWIALLLATWSLNLVANLDELINLVEESGLVVISHVFARVRSENDKEFSEGWILLAQEANASKRMVALFGGDAGLAGGHGVSYGDLPGVAYQLRDYLELRSVTQWAGKTGILVQLTLTLTPHWGKHGGRGQHPERFSVKEAIGRYQIINLPWEDKRREMYVDMATARNPKRRSLCSYLLIRASSVAESMRLF